MRLTPDQHGGHRVVGPGGSLWGCMGLEEQMARIRLPTEGSEQGMDVCNSHAPAFLPLLAPAVLSHGPCSNKSQVNQLEVVKWHRPTDNRDLLGEVILP